MGWPRVCSTPSTYGNVPPTRRGSELTRQATSASKPKPATLTKSTCPGRCGPRPDRWPAARPGAPAAARRPDRPECAGCARNRSRSRPGRCPARPWSEPGRWPPRGSAVAADGDDPLDAVGDGRPRQLARVAGQLRCDRLPLAGRRPAERPLQAPPHARGAPLASRRIDHDQRTHRSLRPRRRGSRSARRGGARRRPADTTLARPSPYTPGPARRRTA